MSIKLPRQLATWEPELKIFPEEIALAIGAMAQRIAALVGPYFHYHVQGQAAPDGFAGLAKRGTYDRLIASDWLLADELPDEFMRRSVMGEHLFWKIAHREPASSRSTLVLFDAGPEQLGSPRLLQLAALAVLAARARIAKASFQWGILQRPECGLLPGVNTAEIELFLNARGSASATAEHFANWSQILPAASHGGETWVVGHARLLKLIPDTTFSLLIRDVLSPMERKLQAECRSTGKHSRNIEVELPPPSTCAQLLRDPFAAAAVSPSSLDIGSAVQNVVLNPSGNKLWVRTEHGGVIAIPIPNSPREVTGKPRRYDTLSRFPQIAIGRVGRTTVLISINPVSLALTVRQIGRPLTPGLKEGQYDFLDSRTRPLFQHSSFAVCVWHSGASPGLYLMDEAGLLLRLFADESGKWCEVVHTHGLALTLSQSGLCYAVYGSESGADESAQFNRVLTGDNLTLAKAWPSPEAPYRAFFGYGGATGPGSFGQLALGYSETHWEICNRNARIQIAVPDGFKVYGVIQARNYEETLIVVEENLKTLSLHGAHGTRRLLQASAPIIAVSGCQRHPSIAYATDAGDIFVYSLKHERAVLAFTRSAS